jgi:hypothetical protein
MSLWAATVITNLLSSIPVFGQDLVESNNATELSTCYFNEAFIFGTETLHCSSTTLLCVAGYPVRSVAAKQSPALMYMQEDQVPSFCSVRQDGQEAGAALSVLPTVGTVSPHALKKGNKIRKEAEVKREYLTIPYQFIAFLAGFIDGDGYLQITRTTKGFIAIKLVITLSLEDLSTLEYIHSVLKLGRLTISRDIRYPTCTLIINRTDLQEIIFPLLIHHGIFFLTETRRAQFDKAMYIFKNEIKLYDLVPNVKEISTEYKLPITPYDYLELAFFKN